MLGALAARRVIKGRGDDADEAVKLMERRIAAALAQKELGMTPAFVMGEMTRERNRHIGKPGIAEPSRHALP